jgi:hypothetical protein
MPSGKSVDSLEEIVRNEPSPDLFRRRFSQRSRSGQSAMASAMVPTTTNPDPHSVRISLMVKSIRWRPARYGAVPLSGRTREAPGNRFGGL